MREASLLVPGGSGAVWIGVFIALLAFGDFARPLSRRNLALAGLLALAPLLANINAISRTSYAPLVFTGIFLLTAAYAAWGAAMVFGKGRVGLTSSIPRTGLRIALCLVLTMDVIVIFGRAPNDAGIYSSLGGQRWFETGTLPYGDAKLLGPDAPGFGAAATYGPLLYAAHVPFQILVGTRGNPADANPMDPSYQRPRNIVTRLALLTFFGLGLWAIYGAARSLAGEDTALAATVLFAGCPYVIGLGGTDRTIAGLAYISHIAPAATLLLAFRFRDKPATAGVLLAAAVGVLFWPVFLFPAWLGWYFTRGRNVARFALGFIGAGVVLGLIVVLMTNPRDPGAAIMAVLQSTLEHQEGFASRQYGQSAFGFWGTHPDLAAFWQRPITGTISLLKPTFLLFAALCVAAPFMVRGRDAAALAAITACLAAAIQLWKTHAQGSYVEWYWPFLLLALLVPVVQAAGEPRPGAPATG